MHARTILLTGNEVALTAMTEADQVSFHQWMQDPKLRALIDDPRIPTMEDQMRWFLRVQQPDRKFFSLVTVPDGTLIGNCGFVDIGKGKATLRITIGRSEYQGRGLGSETVGLLVRYAFDIAHWDSIVLHVLESNIRAIRSYEKSGFTVQSKEEKDGKTIITMSLHRQSSPAQTKRGDVPCSVMMYVRNGGSRFERCVQSCLPLREHVVLDGGSTDGTIELAKKYGCRILKQDPAYLDATGRIIDFGGIATQAYKATSGEWIVLIAADEELNSDFIQAVQHVIAQGKPGAYLVDRFFVVDGRVRKYLSIPHNYQMRFCHRSCVLGFTKMVHERPVYAEGVVPQVLPGGYLHLPLLESSEELREKYNRYLALDKQRLALRGYGQWILFMLKRLTVMTAMFLRVMWIRILHDRNDCLPWRYEKLYFWYGFQLIKRSCPLLRKTTV